MPRTAFNKLPSREKWDRYKDMKGDFYCPNCGTKTDKPYRASPFHGAEVCCGNCDHTLTRRTGGGQSDPFNWHYGKPKLSIDQRRRAAGLGSSCFDVESKHTATIGASRIGFMGGIFRVTYPDGDTNEFKAETWLEAVREIGGHATKLEVIGEYEITDDD